MKSKVRFEKFMQQFEFALKRYSYRMLIHNDRQVAVPCCCVYNLSEHVRCSRGGSHDVNAGWSSHKLFLIQFFPLKVELITF
jgi:hypothetical protein